MLAIMRLFSLALHSSRIPHLPSINRLTPCLPLQIFTILHEAATEIPIAGKAIPAIINKDRIFGYIAGEQQFDYPIHKMRVIR